MLTGVLLVFSLIIKFALSLLTMAIGVHLSFESNRYIGIIVTILGIVFWAYLVLGE